MGSLPRPNGAERAGTAHSEEVLLPVRHGVSERS